MEGTPALSINGINWSPFKCLIFCFKWSHGSSTRIHQMLNIRDSCKINFREKKEPWINHSHFHWPLGLFPARRDVGVRGKRQGNDCKNQGARILHQCAGRHGNWQEGGIGRWGRRWRWERHRALEVTCTCGCQGLAGIGKLLRQPILDRSWYQWQKMYFTAGLKVQCGEYG